MDASVADLKNMRPDIRVIHTTDWTEFDYIIFNNLNAAPKLSDKNFAVGMKDLFENHLQLKVNPNVNILFGQNLRFKFHNMYQCTSFCYPLPNLKTFKHFHKKNKKHINTL